MTRIWDSFLTEQDRVVYKAAGYGKRTGFGRRPAVLVVDVNYLFTGIHGQSLLESIRTSRNSCGPVAWIAIPHIRSLLDVARDRQLPVFFSTGITRRPDGFDDGSWAFKSDRSIAQRIDDFASIDPQGNTIVAEIAPLPHEIVIRKLKPSPFAGTPLASYLVDLQVDSLIVCGTSTSGCVRAAVLDAFSQNYRIIVAEEGTFDRFESSMH